MRIIDRNYVCIGGGTGLSTMLSGLKKYTENLTAIVTVSDNGGSSGILRREMNILPPGDIRNCLLALAETEPIMEKIFQYRFEEGTLEGQSFGNLFIAALNGIYGSFELAVEKATEVLAVKGKVLPVTTQNVELCARYKDNTEIIGESEIVMANKLERKEIDTMSLVPKTPMAYYKAIEALENANIIILGPGSLYTSIVPNLLVNGIPEAIKRSSAKVIYVSNIMTQPGETDNYTLNTHIEVIEKYLGKNILKYIIVNDEEIDENILNLYEEDGASQVVVDITPNNNIKVIRAPLVRISSENKFIRHDPLELAKVIIGI